MDEQTDSRVFNALSDPTRRRLLDVLRQHNGQRSKALCVGFAISRQAVMKHLDILEDAGLVTAVRGGHKTIYLLNREPLRRIQHDWLARFTGPQPR